MDPATLVDPKTFEEGRQAVKAIRNAGVSVRMAFWAYFEMPSEWRLVIIAPQAEREGSRKVYVAIKKALTKENIDFPLRLITVVAPKTTVAQLGLNCDTMVPIRAGSASTGTPGGDWITVDSRYIYRDDSESAG